LPTKALAFSTAFTLVFSWSDVALRPALYVRAP